MHISEFELAGCCFFVCLFCFCQLKQKQSVGYLSWSSIILLTFQDLFLWVLYVGCDASPRAIPEPVLAPVSVPQVREAKVQAVLAPLPVPQVILGCQKKRLRGPPAWTVAVHATIIWARAWTGFPTTRVCAGARGLRSALLTESSPAQSSPEPEPEPDGPVLRQPEPDGPVFSEPAQPQPKGLMLPEPEILALPKITPLKICCSRTNTKENHQSTYGHYQCMIDAVEVKQSIAWCFSVWHNSAPSVKDEIA